MPEQHTQARRLTGRQRDYPRVTTDPRVPFDNNVAEREVWMIKQRVSGCLRTFTGARQLCVTCSYLATAAEHSIHFFVAFTTLAQGRP